MEKYDPLGPARGIMTGIFIGAALWVAIFFLIYLFIKC